MGIEKRVKSTADQSVELYKYMNDKVYCPLKNNVYVIYDQGSKYISVMIEVIKEH